MPRSKVIPDLRVAARTHTHMALNVLAGVARQPKSPAAARVMAAGMLLDRGWGKAPQNYSEGEMDIRVTIRHILEHVDEKPVIIDGKDVRCIDKDITKRCIDADTTVDANVVPDDESNLG